MIVEDGSGLATANSYVATSDANTFHADRANTAWAAATTPAREAALINATDYIDANYNFLSVPASTTQALMWPQVGVTGIPATLLKAVMVLALEALSTSLNPAQVANSIASSEKSLDGVGSSKTVFNTVKQARFPSVDALMSGISSGRKGSSIRTISVSRV